MYVRVIRVTMVTPGEVHAAIGECACVLGVCVVSEWDISMVLVDVCVCVTGVVAACFCVCEGV